MEKKQEKNQQFQQEEQYTAKKIKYQEPQQQKKKIYVQKKKYIQKTKYIQKDTKKVEPKILKTTVINVKVKYLRQLGYNSLEEWLENDNHIYIGRDMTVYVKGAYKSKWHNPFKVDNHGRNHCLQLFREYLLNNQQLMKQIKELKGKVLGCWCHPQGCHGHILAQLADSL